MEYFPSPRGFRRTEVYSVVVGVVAILLVDLVFVTQDSVREGLFALAVLGPLAYVLYGYWALKEYGYDRGGVYRRGRQLFGWAGVRKITLSFRNRSGSVTLMANPGIRSILSGPLVERESWVEYQAAVVFDLEDGSVVLVPSNLNSLAERGVLENVIEVARSANPKIEFE